MNTPAYYDTVPPITMTDPLAETLGSAEGGTLEYRYLDAVKLTGHSCPTVAGAWRMTRDALARLYPQGTPRRGEIRVDLREALDDGVAGVIASVVSLVTGAANAGGLKGFAGRHGRKDLLAFGVPMRGDIRFTRLDDGRSVEFTRQGFAVPRSAELTQLLRAAVAPEATEAARRAFAQRWSGWVEQMTDPACPPEWVETAA